MTLEPRLPKPRSARRLSVALLSGLLAAPLCGCESKSTGEGVLPQEASFPVSIRAHSEAGSPVANVELYLKTRLVGKTDALGNARIVLPGAEGDTAALSIKCPEAYYSPERETRVALRHLDNGSAARFEVECLARVHQIVVGLRAENGPNLPILRLKNIVGQTDETGVAHVLLEASANEEVALTLDTSQNKNLQPQSPTLDFTTGVADELVLVSQKFTVKEPARVQHIARAIPRHL